MSQPYDPNSPDQLDRLLQSWQAARQADPDRLSALQRQIVARLAAEPAANRIVPSSHEERRGGLAPGGSTWLLAAAAVLLISVGSFWLGRMTGEQAPVGFAKQELADKARLFAEMRGMFGNQLEWLTEANGRVEMGLAGASEAATGQRPVMVKLVVERRTGRGGDWQVVWSTDVIAVDQQQVVARPAGDAALSLWAYRLPDGKLFVESDLVLGGASAVKSVTSNILENNRPTAVKVVGADGAEYRILETAATLDGDLG